MKFNRDGTKSTNLISRIIAPKETAVYDLDRKWNGKMRLNYGRNRNIKTECRRTLKIYMVF